MATQSGKLGAIMRIFSTGNFELGNTLNSEAQEEKLQRREKGSRELISQIWHWWWNIQSFMASVWSLYNKIMPALMQHPKEKVIEQCLQCIGIVQSGSICSYHVFVGAGGLSKLRWSTLLDHTPIFLKEILGSGIQGNILLHHPWLRC
jgi:hypothetical protein